MCPTVSQAPLSAIPARETRARVVAEPEAVADAGCDGHHVLARAAQLDPDHAVSVR